MLRTGVRQIRVYPYKGYKVIYVANRDITEDHEIRDIPLTDLVPGGPALLAVVPKECSDYDLLVGMEDAEALELLEEERESFIEAFYGEELYNGLVRRISGDWDDLGYWSIRGSIPDMEGVLDEF